MKPRKDAAGWYFTPLAFSSDAAAPCFEREERFYSCPVAFVGASLTGLAYDWHSTLSKPGRRDMLPESLSGIVKEAVTAVDNAIAMRERYELDKIRK